MNSRGELLGLLKEARDRISRREAWCRGVMARDAAGLPVPSDCYRAVSFCSLGALLPRQNHSILVMLACRELRNTLKSRGLLAVSVPLFNDDPSTKHEDVLSVFDETIQRLENEQ